MPLRINFSATEKFVSNLESAANDIDKLTQDVLEAIANEVINVAKQNTAVGNHPAMASFYARSYRPDGQLQLVEFPTTPLDGGKLKNSYEIQNLSGNSVDIANTADYASDYEYGHRTTVFNTHPAEHEGFVDGKYPLKNACDDAINRIQNIADPIITQYFDEKLGE